MKNNPAFAISNSTRPWGQLWHLYFAGLHLHFASLLILFHPLLGAVTPSTTPGCSEPRPSWPWTLPVMEETGFWSWAGFKLRQWNSARTGSCVCCLLPEFPPPRNGSTPQRERAEPQRHLQQDLPDRHLKIRFSSCVPKETQKAPPATGNISFNVADGLSAAQGQGKGDLMWAQAGAGGWGWPQTHRAVVALPKGFSLPKRYPKAWCKGCLYQTAFPFEPLEFCGQLDNTNTS